MFTARRVVVAAIAAATFAGSVLYAEAAQKSRLNDGPGGVAPQSPIGTNFGSANLWAVVNGDGTVDRSDGANLATTQRLSTGNYEVIFKRRVDVCAFSAVVGPSSAGTASGIADVATRAGNNNGVFVETRDFAGALVDRPFHLVVNC